METKFAGLLAVVTVFLWLAGTADAQQKDLRELRLSVFRIDAATAVARAHGLFAKEGLDLKIAVTANSTDLMRGISKGTFDLVSGAFDNVLAWSGREGSELAAVAQTADTLITPLFVRPDIRRWNDLRGKKLAVDAVDSAFAFVLRRILLAHDLDLKRGDYEIIPVGATELRLESMKRGETFAAILTAPFDTQATEAGMVRLADSREVLPNYPDSVWVVNRAWVKNHRDELVAFLRAWLAGMRWAGDPANRDQVIKLIAADLRVSPTAAAGVLARLSVNGSLNVAGLQSVLDLRNQFGFTPAMGADLKPYYDLSYFREAAGK